MSLIVRFLCAMLSAVIFVWYMPSPAQMLFRLLYSDCWSEDCYAAWSWYNALAFDIQIITVALWMALWTFLEIRRFKRLPSPAPKLLTHIRYGPIAVFVFSLVAIAAFNLALIQYSRFQIIRYVHSDAPVTERPSFELHNNYRHWCGNGMAANEYALYGDTPAAYIDDPDPATRARALQASMYVYDWINNPQDGPSIEVLKKAAADPDPLIRAIAAHYNSEVHYSAAP